MYPKNASPLSILLLLILLLFMPVYGGCGDDGPTGPEDDLPEEPPDRPGSSLRTQEGEQPADSVAAASTLLNRKDRAVLYPVQRTP